MARKKGKMPQRSEVTHEIGDGFVIFWDTDAVAVDLRDELSEAASDEVERFSHNLVEIAGDAVIVAKGKTSAPRRRRVSPPAAA